jgi:tripartite ATP-independent transporter DctM subunit
MLFTISGLVAIVLFILLMFLGMNIPFAMMFSSVVSIVILKGPVIAGQTLIAGLDETFTNYALTVAPMFGLMGYLATHSGIGAKMFVFLKTMIGHRHAGLPAAVQVASAAFGAICGSPPATAAAMTAVAYPEMRKAGYSVQLSALCVQDGSGLSVLIPPSATMIIFGIVTDNSVGRLFLAGLLPGIISCIGAIILCRILVQIHPEWGATGQKATWKERFKALRSGGLLEVIIVFVVSMGGMWGGVFTPTEAGAVGAFGMLIVALVGRNLNYKKLRRSLIEGVRLSAMMYLLMAGAGIFGKALAMSRLPFVMGNFIGNSGFPPFGVLMMIVAFYFAVGFVADFMSMMLITIPIFYPIMTEYCGYDPAWFAVLIIMMHGIGSLTPPMGIGIFMQKTFITPYDPGISTWALFKATPPWIVLKFILLGTIIAVPQIVTILPDTFL